MKKQQPITNERLLEIRNEEIKKYGDVYTDRRKTVEEMLRMRGVKF
jgi:hypothetical protein